MTHKERILMAINHEEPDRVPVDAWLTPEVKRNILAHIGEDAAKNIPDSLPEFLKLPYLMDHDSFSVEFGPVTGFYLKDDPEYYDEWGIKWKWVENSSGKYTEMIEHPLKNIEDPADFKMPDFKDPARYEKARLCVEKFGKEYAIFGGIPCTLYELAWFLRGMDQVMVDMLINKDFMHAYLDRLIEWAIDAGTNLARIGVDVIWVGDDFGGQDRMLIDPELFREFFKPRYAKLFTILRQINKNIKFAFHCDGYLYPIVKDLIEIGVDILNPIQPKAIDPDMLKKEFGKNLTFWGTVENQEIMPFGTVQQVIEETKYRLRTLAPGGGLIIAPSHGVQPVTLVEKIFAFYETVKKYGVYPINI